LGVYTARKFGLLVSIGCIIGVVVVASTVWSIDIFFPIKRMIIYQQTINYDIPSSKISPVDWAKLNHTIIVSDDNVIESVLTVTTKTEPPYPGVKIEVYFGTYPQLIPELVDGNLKWSGQMHENETKTLLTTLKLTTDGKYFIGGQAVSYLTDGTSEGFGTIYYVTVEGGRISQVTDELGETPPHEEVKRIR
jgi:hypothetical protein